MLLVIALTVLQFRYIERRVQYPIASTTLRIRTRL
jgi:hypothetical protein